MTLKAFKEQEEGRPSQRAETFGVSSSWTKPITLLFRGNILCDSVSELGGPNLATQQLQRRRCIRGGSLLVGTANT